MTEANDTTQIQDVTQEDRPVDSIEERARHFALHTPEGFLAFGFGSGLLTGAPGTMGTLVALPVAVAVNFLGINGFWFVLMAFLVGVWACDRVTRQMGVEDYGGIVWDEMVGYWLAVMFIPFHWGWFLAAFVLFRGFDILKPWPISLLEESFEGGFGIMIDDVLAAVYTMLILMFVETQFLAV